MSGVGQESDLLYALAKGLGHVSRQRVRYIQMELRKYSTDARMRNERHFWTVLENNGIRFSKRTASQFLNLIKDQRGINIEVASRYLKESQKKTRRDSVEALIVGEITAEKKKKKKVKTANEDIWNRNMSLRKRMSLDEFRRLGRLVVNATTLTKKQEEFLVEEPDIDPALLDGEEDGEKDNILRMLMDTNGSPSDDSVCEETEEQAKQPKADQPPPRMKYLPVPTMEEKSLPTDYDPLVGLDPNGINVIDIPKRKSKKSKSKKSPCTITITVEDADANQDCEETTGIGPEDEHQQSVGVHEQTTERRPDENSGQIVIEIPEELPMRQQEQYYREIQRLGEMNKDDEQHSEDIISSEVTTPEEITSSAEWRQEERTTCEENEQTTNLNNDYPPECEEKPKLKDDIEENQTEILENNFDSESSDFESLRGEQRPEEENTSLSSINDEKEQEKNADLVGQIKQKSGTEDALTGSVCDSENSENIAVEIKDDFEPESDCATVDTVTESVVENPNIYDGEKESCPLDFDGEASVTEQSEEDIPDYSTDSFIADDTSEDNETDVQSSSVDDEDERQETDCDTRSIADYGGEIIPIGGYEITVFPPEWHKDKVYTDIICNKSTSSQPKQEVEWVYGCEISHSQSMAALGDHEIVYGSGCIVVLYNYARHSQRHYFGHSGPITCVAVHPDQTIVGSAQSESTSASKMLNTLSDLMCNSSKLEPNHGRIHIRVWNAVDLTTMYIMGVGSFQQTIRKMQFMKFRNYILTIEDDNDSSLTLWDGGCKLKKVATVINFPDMSEPNTYQRNTRNGKAELSKKPELWSRGIAATSMHGAEFVIAGKEHLGFWKIRDISKSYSAEEKFVKITGPLRGDFVKHFRPRYVTCCVQTERNGVGLYVSGDTNGTILVWSETQKEVVAGAKHAHECPISCIIVTKSHIFTGGATDRTISAFSWGKDDMERVGSASLPSNVGQVSTICQVGCHLFVGTNQNLIVTVEIVHSSYSFGRLKSKKPTVHKKNKTEEDEEQSTMGNIFGHWDPVDVARGSRDAFKCVCTTEVMKKRYKSTRTPTPPTEATAKRSSRSAGSRRTPAVPENRPIKSARPYNAAGKTKSPVADSARSQTPDGPPKLAIAFSSPKLRAHERILKREKLKNEGISEITLSFALENYIDKKIFASTVFPKGLESKPKDEDKQDPSANFFFAASNDGWITVFDAHEHSTIGRMKLAITRDIICMDCCSRRSVLALGCADGHVIVIQVNADGFQTLSDAYFRGKRAPRRPINSIRFSKHGKKVAFSVGNEIVIASVKTSGLHEIERCLGHGTDHIISLDWSSAKLRGADLIRSCALVPEPEILVWSTEPAENIEDLSTVRNIEWETESSPIDFAVKGLWEQFSNPVEFSCLSVSNGKLTKKENATADNDKENSFSNELSQDIFEGWRKVRQPDYRHPASDSVFCVGDIAGSVRCYLYPSICSEANETVSRVFHSPVNCLTASSEYLLATGKEDRSVVQFDISQKNVD